MKFLFINKSDATGGAAVVTFRLMQALREAGQDARMLVEEKRTDSPYVELGASRGKLRQAFISERLKIFLRNGLRRDTLFQIDTATDGVALWRHPWVKDADVICLNWVNQGLLSLKGVERIGRLGKLIIWTMHDMWNFTGICHHAGTCARYREHCGKCPLYGRLASAHDPSDTVWRRKQRLYGDTRITFVAVSHWLAAKAAESSLLRNQDVRVIPNAFPFTEKDINAVREMRANHDKIMHESSDFVIIMGAARLDDPIKGLPILVHATQIIKTRYPELAKHLVLCVFGSLRDEHALDDVAIRLVKRGRLNSKEVREAYCNADIVVSSSLYETLPGTLIEGQAYGCVPVAFNRGGQSDIIDNGVTGIICEFDNDKDIAASNLADALANACTLVSDDTRRAMARSVVERFSAAKVAKHYVGLAEELLHQNLI